MSILRPLYSCLSCCTPSLEKLNGNNGSCNQSTLQVPNGLSQAGVTAEASFTNFNFPEGNYVMVDNKAVHLNLNNTEREDIKLMKDRLSGYCEHNAKLHSFTRSPPPQCYEGTRTELLADALRWIAGDSDHDARVLWLSGPAGVGKSAIAQTLGLMCEAKNVYGGGFFFSGKRDPNLSRSIFPTIAYNLSTLDYIPTYAKDLVQILENDPTVLGSASITHQFQKLIAEPLSRLRFPNNRKLVIIIDGLDECANGDDQDEITRLIFNISHPKNVSSELPILWVVCSRTDTEINRLVTQDLHHRYKLKSLSIEESMEEVTFFIHKKFDEYRSRYSSTVGESRPREDEVKMLCDLSSGLFALAATFFRYLDGKKGVGRRTDVHISSVLDTLTGKVRNGMKVIWTANIDTLYTRILGGISVDSMQTALVILHTLATTSDDGDHLLHSRNMQEFSNLLGLNEYQLYEALMSLECVLDIPHSEDADKKNLAFLHASFPDFLHDPTRSKDYGIDENQVKLKVFERVLKILQSDIVLTSLTIPPWYISNMSTDQLYSLALPHLQWPHSLAEASRKMTENITQSAIRTLLLLLTHDPEWQRKFNFNMFAYFDCVWRFPISLFLKIGRTLNSADEEDRKLLQLIEVTYPDASQLDYNRVRDTGVKHLSYICLGHAENSVLVIITQDEGNKKYGQITFYSNQAPYDVWPHVFERTESEVYQHINENTSWKVNLDLSFKKVLREKQ